MQFSFSFDFFFWGVWAHLGNFWGTWGGEQMNFFVFWDFFLLFVLGLTELGSLFWNPFFFLIYGVSIKGSYLKVLGTLFFYPRHIQGPLWSFLRTPLSQSIFEKPLKP
jgi:hypothetical protein